MNKSPLNIENQQIHETLVRSKINSIIKTHENRTDRTSQAHIAVCEYTLGHLATKQIDWGNIQETSQAIIADAFQEFDEKDRDAVRGIKEAMIAITAYARGLHDALLTTQTLQDASREE